jgi:transglycosylase-like protein
VARYFVAGALVGAVFATVLGAALGIHAQDEGDMGGRADLTGQGSSKGEEEPGVEAVTSPAPPAPEDANPTVGSSAAQQPIPHYGTWLRLVGCEAGGDWHNASNRIYKGGLQFDSSTWARHGGLNFAWRADFATPQEQMIVAERTLAAQGWGAWPACSRKLGLR